MHRYLMKSWCEIEYAKIFWLPNWSNISVILGRGYASSIVFSFNAQKSITILHLLFPCECGFLGTIYMGELYGEFKDLITSFFIKFSTCLLISSLWKGGNLYCLVFMGLSLIVTILCAVTSIWPNGSSHKRNKSPYLLMILCTWIVSFLLRWPKRKSSRRKWLRKFWVYTIAMTLIAPYLDAFSAATGLFRTGRLFRSSPIFLVRLWRLLLVTILIYVFLSRSFINFLLKLISCRTLAEVQVRD